MGERIEEIKQKISNAFPKLIHDKGFKISSKADPDYNCIAWACNYDERWIEPPIPGMPDLDCVIWWPPGVPEGSDPAILKKLFEHYGYTECDSGEHENGYKKVDFKKSPYLLRIKYGFSSKI